ncbi:MAG: hypothetical protein ABI277_07895 [Burkholderiaceae bacterium]
MLNARVIGAGIATLLAMSACSPMLSKRSDLGNGWRIGTIVRTGDAESLGPMRENDCRRVGALEAGGAQRYASVQYFSGRHAHLRIVPIDDALNVQEGDSVYLRLTGCNDAIMQ